MAGKAMLNGSMVVLIGALFTASGLSASAGDTSMQIAAGPAAGGQGQAEGD